MAANKKSRDPSSRPRSNPGRTQTSSPEINLSTSAVGRETLAAITSELVKGRLVSRPSRRPVLDSGPEIVVIEGPVGRETLAVIEAELHPGREPLETLPYGDRVPNAPGAATPSKWPPRPKNRRSKSSRPPTTRDRPTVASTSVQPSPDAGVLEIFEMLTFVVRNPRSGDLSTDALRRRFVEEHLLHRLPGHSLASAAHVDVTPWTQQNTVIVRVWVRVESA